MIDIEQHIQKRFHDFVEKTPRSHVPFWARLASINIIENYLIIHNEIVRARAIKARNEILEER